MDKPVPEHAITGTRRQEHIRDTGRGLHPQCPQLHAAREYRAAGANVLAGTGATQIAEAADRMISQPREWQNPYGDGEAAERIVEICRTML